MDPSTWSVVDRQGWTPEEQADIEALVVRYDLSAVDAIQEYMN